MNALRLLAIVALAASTVAQAPVAPTAPWGSMVGEVRSTSALAWIRTDIAASVILEITDDSALRNMRRVGPAMTSYLGSAKIEVRELKPATRYFYRFELANATALAAKRRTALGTFVTAPEGPKQVRFAFSADIYPGTSTSIPLAAQMAAPAFDFYLSLGDMPYADGSLNEIDYSAKHAAIRKLPDLIQLWRSTSVYATFDDHEIFNDWDASIPPHLVRAGLDTFLDWMPLAQTSPRRLYRSFKWGDHLRVLMLDTRTQRGFNADPDGPGHTMLGAEQLLWLKHELAEAKETFKVIVSSVPVRSGVKNRDHWEGYQFERRAIFDHIRDEGVSNVVFLTGDHHIGAIIEHPEGIVEAIGGPLQASVGVPPLDRDPTMRQAGSGRNYGHVTVLPTSPPRMQIEIRGLSEVLCKKTIVARTPGRLEYSAGLGDAQFHASGPHSIQFTGRRASFGRVPAGDYKISAIARNGLRTLVPSCEVTVPDGGFASLGVLAAVDATRLAELLHSDDFEGNGTLPADATVVDDPKAVRGPSSWFIDDHRLWHASPITLASGLRPATTILLGEKNAGWTDQVVRARIRPWGDGTISMLFRAKSAGDAYVFQLDRAAGARRLIKLVGGVPTVLASDGKKPLRWQTQLIECRATGNLLETFVDGQRVFSVRDSTHASGRVGFGSRGSRMFSVQTLRVYSSLPDEQIVDEHRFATSQLTNWTVVDEGKKSNWVVSEGSLLQRGDASGSGPARPGTNLLRNGVVIDDASLSFRVGGAGGGGVGALVRALGARDGYRFQMDGKAGFMRLERLVAGRATTLATRALSYETVRYYGVEILCEGDRLSVRLDGEEILSATDSYYARGGYGLYSYDEDVALFDDVVVRRLTGEPAWTCATGKERSFDVSFHARGAASEPMIALLSDDEQPALGALATLDPELRLLPLRPGSLFNLSLQLGLVRVFDRQDQAKVALTFPADSYWHNRRIVIGGLRLNSRMITPLATTALRPQL